MKLGVCTTIDNSEFLKKVGFDYIEMGLNSIAAMSDEDFQILLEKVQASSIKPYSFNVLLPSEIMVTGDNVNEDIISNYLTKAFNRARNIGGKVVVFGSGRSRAIPEGFDREKAFKQLVEFLKIAGNIAEKNDITVVIEPLRSAETNIINTAEEGLRLAKAVNHDNIKLLVDFYHMVVEGESPEILLKAGSHYIKHIHIANPGERTWPISTTEADYKPFIKNLIEIGYTGGISIEGATKDLENDAPLSLQCLRDLLER